MTVLALEARNFASPPRDGFAFVTVASGLINMSASPYRAFSHQSSSPFVHALTGRNRGRPLASIAVELRRALLLFAIVLGLAAIATSFSRPADEKEPEPPRTQQITPGLSTKPATERKGTISFSAAGKPQTRRLRAGRAAVVTVEVARPGQVQLVGLGVNTAAEPRTPARFDVFESQAGSYDVRFMPATSAETRSIGTLRIVP